MLPSVSCLIKSGTKLRTFNENNRWVDIGEFSTITPTMVKTQGVLFDKLSTPTDNIKLVWTKLQDNPDGSSVFYSEDIFKTMMVTALEAITENSIDKLKLTVSQFLPKDTLLVDDRIYCYSSDAAFAPQIVNVAFSSTIVHDANISMVIDTVYNYDSKVKYAVKINGGAYSNWTSEIDPFNKLTLPILTENLNIGDNTITIKVSNIDETKVTEKIMVNAIRVDNSQPTVTIVTADSNAFKVHFRIADTDVTDLITYKLSLVNSKGTFVISDWSTPVVQPIETLYNIDTTNVLVDTINIIKIEYKDGYGITGSSEYNFVGKYNNVVFTDENGDYYVTDKGVMLKLLQFEDLPAGKTSEIREINLKNSSSTDIQDLIIRIVDNTNLNGIAIQLSKTRYPFNPLESIDYGTQILKTDDTVQLFIRIDTTINAVGGCNFAITADSNMAETPII